MCAFNPTAMPPPSAEQRPDSPPPRYETPSPPPPPYEGDGDRPPPYAGHGKCAREGKGGSRPPAWLRAFAATFLLVLVASFLAGGAAGARWRAREVPRAAEVPGGEMELRWAAEGGGWSEGGSLTVVDGKVVGGGYFRVESSADGGEQVESRVRVMRVAGRGGEWAHFAAGGGHPGCVHGRRFRHRVEAAEAPAYTPEEVHAEAESMRSTRVAVVRMVGGHTVLVPVGEGRRRRRHF